MPNRIIRAGINSSDRVNQLDYAEEVFYRRLMTAVDDYGLFDARPSILRAQLYPLRIDRVREADISRWLAACEKAGLILLYEAEFKPYLWVRDTQWTGRAEPKFPLPPGTELIRTGKSLHLQTSANNCAQMQTDENNCKQLRPYSDSYSDSLSLSNSGEPPKKPNDDDGQPVSLSLSDAVAQAMGMKLIPEGKPGEKLRIIAEEFRLAGIQPVEVGEFVTDWYARKMQKGQPNAVLIPDYLANDLPGWVKARRMRQSTALKVVERKFRCETCQDSGSISVFENKKFVRYADCECQKRSVA